MTAQTPAPAEMLDLWERHRRLELARPSDPTAFLTTMTDSAQVNHIPVITGGKGQPALHDFYRDHYFPGLPRDLAFQSVFRSCGDGRVIDEYVLEFTHDVRMDWLLPGVEPTGKAVKLAAVTVAQFEGSRIADKRTYWDQASVLVQLGLLDPAGLPVAGVEQALKVLHPDQVPSNELIWRAQGTRWEMPEFTVPEHAKPPPIGREGLQELWTEHLTHEFITLDAEATIQTMVPHAHVNHVPTLTGGTGHAQLLYFYSRHFIGQRDPEVTGIPMPTLRTIGADFIVDENSGTLAPHTLVNDYALPGVEPTGKSFARPRVIIVSFEGDKLAYEHLYWDQATTICQLGLWDPGNLPVTGAEQAAKMADFDSVPSNELIRRAHARRA